MENIKLTSGQLLRLLLLLLVAQAASAQKKETPRVVNMLFSSDAHYGLTRAFRGDTGVTGHSVNATMIAQMNTMPGIILPADSGVNSGTRVGAVDYVVQTGDIANRMEAGVQIAAASWAQFEQDYLHGLKLRGHDSKRAQVLVTPGNHDISNAIGYGKPMTPATDPTAMVKIYNLMLKPKQPLTNETYNYHTQKVDYSRNIGGVHFMFLTLWPDSAQRIWMQADLDTVSATTPVIIFTHDQPTCEAKHFTNPVAPFTMTQENKFENLTEERYKEGLVATANGGNTAIEQRGWVAFLKRHPNIKAYFHGNSNYNEFYTYKGPDDDVDLKVFRVDSPMKGKYSAKDETKLSFQLISLDPDKQILTVRECLWDTEPLLKSQKISFGATATVSLKVN
ncbi:metallophosphoesterase family protein [Mucilaginibacter psychrotolerans]|uniref:Calcineurin-like phosphoesterase domain-containing protein n=1 Tax=Mucilaginibacter psychrotolerans TaxID=1524096 RepID=A0A4Y8SJ17_9SPHI|nr:metallophosphoesterase [Mucilaginibacter psychrotolerans]TFF38416.1 hypothetical protein E2R66_08070 [Mucilaginibacter psychrotolerans]